jgi:uncharacterized glyoxalase superfamily protein PhnB
LFLQPGRHSFPGAPTVFIGYDLILKNTNFTLSSLDFMNKFNSLRPMLWTDKLKETIDFYTGVLGFQLNEFSEDWGWANLSKNNVTIMLAKPNEHEGFDGTRFTGSFYINVDNADALWNELRTKTKVCYEIETFDWGMREFAVYDNNGYILQFGHEVQS